MANPTDALNHEDDLIPNWNHHEAAAYNRALEIQYEEMTRELRESYTGNPFSCASEPTTNNEHQSGVREPNAAPVKLKQRTLLSNPELTLAYTERAKSKGSQRPSKPIKKSEPKTDPKPRPETPEYPHTPFPEDNRDHDESEPNTEDPDTTKRRSFYGFTYRQNRSMTLAFYLREIQFENPIGLTLIYRGRSDAMTYQGVRKQMDSLRRLYRSAWGHDIQGIWKIESTGKGVAHIHEYMDKPSGVATHATKAENNAAKFEHLNGLEFEQWIDLAWQEVTKQTPTDIMPHLTWVTPNVTKRGSQIYFSKAGRRNPKSYQNKCPEGWEDEMKLMQLWGRHGLKKMRSDTVRRKIETDEEFELFKEALSVQAAEDREVFDMETGEVIEVLGTERFKTKVGTGGYDVGGLDIERASKYVESKLERQKRIGN